MERKIILILLILTIFPMNLAAQNIGVALSQTNGTVTVFDQTGPLGSLTLGGGFPLVGDCAITPDGSMALVTDFVARAIHVIDLADPANPVIAGGTNPILTTSRAEDISLTPDGQFAAVCGVGDLAVGNDEFVSIIDVGARTEVDAFPTGTSAGCEAVEICDDGVSVLAVIGRGPDTVRRFTLDGAGQLTDTGETLLLPGEGVNLACAPGSQSGAVVNSFSGIGQTFTIPGLGLVSTPPVPAIGQSVRIHPSGNQIFFRSTVGTQQISSFSYDSASGIVGALQYAIPVPFSSAWLGIDTFDINPDGSTFTASDDVNSQAVTFNTADGTVSASPAPFAVPFGATGVCFGMPYDSDGDGVPNDEDVCPDTVIPESVPTEYLGVNRFALTDGDGEFDTVTRGAGTPHGYSIQDTAGCSCEQIINALGLGKGHSKFGCSNSVMQSWVDLVTP